MANLNLFEEKHYCERFPDKVIILLGDDVVEEIPFEDAELGHGHWVKVIDILRQRGHKVEPEEFGYIVASRYYDSRRKELDNKPEIAKELKYFKCEKCQQWEHKMSFKFWDVCDNCRDMRQEEWEEVPWPEEYRWTLA